MPKKINQKEEKRARNELHADRFKVESDEPVEKAKKRTPHDAKYANWCRNKNHPPSCSCVYN